MAPSKDPDFVCRRRELPSGSEETASVPDRRSGIQRAARRCFHPNLGKPLRRQMMLSRKPILPDSTRRGVMLGDGSRKQAEGLGSTRAAGREHDEEVPGLRAIRHNLADRRRRWLLVRTLRRHFGRRRGVQCRFWRGCRVYHGDPTLGAVSSCRPFRDRSRSVSRVPPLAIHEVSEGRSEPQDTANAFQDVGGPRLPELSKGLDVDSGVCHGPEGRHETERPADDDEEHPREAKGPCPLGQVAPRTSG